MQNLKALNQLKVILREGNKREEITLREENKHKKRKNRYRY